MTGVQPCALPIYESNLFVRRTKLVEPPREIDVATWRSERRGLFQPWNFHHQTIRLITPCLQALIDTANPVNRPRSIRKAHRLVDFSVLPLAETLATFK